MRERDMKKESLQILMKNLRAISDEYEAMGCFWGNYHLPEAGACSKEEYLLILMCYNGGSLPPLGQMVAPLKSAENLKHIEMVISECRRILAS